MASIGGNLKAQLKARGTTASAFARQLGWQPQRVNDLMNRHGSWELPTLLRVATKLGTSVDVLLAGLDAEYDAQRDQPRHTGTGMSTPSDLDTKDGGDARGAQARLLKHQEEARHRIEDAIAMLTDALGDLDGKDRSAPGDVAEARRRHRKHRR